MRKIWEEKSSRSWSHFAAFLGTAIKKCASLNIVKIVMKNRPTCSNCSPTGRDHWSIKCTTLASEIARASPIANVYGKIDELRQLWERSQQSAAVAVEEEEEEDDERVYWIAQRTLEWGNLSYRPAGLGSGFGVITCFKLFSSSSSRCLVFFLPQSKIYRFT